MKLANICPSCGEPLASFPCGNKDFKPCTKDTRFKRLIVKSREENIIACPSCGFEECFSFWEVQNIELFIATQLAGQSGGLTKAAELFDKRKGD